MGAIRFELVRKDSKKPTAIKLITYNKLLKKRFVFGTGKSITPSEWNFKTMRPLKSGPVTVLLNKLESQYIQTLNHFEYQGLKINEEEIIRRLKAVLKDPFSKSKALTLYEFASDYKDKAITGKVLTKKGTIYAKNTINTYITFLSHWERFGGKNLGLFDISEETIESFISYFNEQDILLNTIGTNIKVLKKFMRLSHKKGIHTNTSYQEFQAYKIDVEDIFLNDDEIERLENLKFTKSKNHFEHYLNVWLIGYYSLQRVSDFNRLVPEHRYITGQGNETIRYFDHKIGELVILPLQKPLQKILENYDWQPPRLRSQKLNRYIKEICKIAEINQPIQYVEHRGGKRQVKSKLKYEMVENHTARRSGATNLYLAGMDMFDIKNLLGHKKIETTQKYIKASKEQIADRIAKHPRFR